MALLGHFKEMVDRKAAAEDCRTLRVEVALASGRDCGGDLVSIFDDGLSILDGNRILFIPLTGVCSLSFEGPVMPPQTPLEDA